MIKTIRHRGLKRLFGRGETRGVQQEHVARLRRILDVLDEAETPADLDLPGYRLHPLKGTFEGFYAVNVSGNWRVIFRFEDGDAADVDYVDYH
ncbi:MAG: type II toxin-antitoxin system RelE/ParE family toxin [Geminicoccaceae bacterium]